MNFEKIENSLGLGVYPSRGLTLVSGSGATVTDSAGVTYIDCTSGVGVANVGHCNQEVVSAINQQASKLITCAAVFSNDVRAKCMDRLVSILPAELDRVFLCNSGTESIEAAIKFARQSTGRPKIVSAIRGFHGRTLGALSATHHKAYQVPFLPLVPEFKNVVYNRISSLENTLDENTAALILEPVQGEGGVRPAAPEYLAAASRLCTERGILLVLDEIQTGFCRTGKMFALEHFDLKPDMLCLAKAMAGGFPIGALVVNRKIKTKMGSHGSTFGGCPLACAAALATIEFLEREKLAERAAKLGRYFVEQLEKNKPPIIRDIRQMGLMIGIELRTKATPILKQLQRHGVLALPAGSTVIRLLPPLVIEKSQLDQVLNKLVYLLNANGQ